MTTTTNPNQHRYMTDPNLDGQIDLDALSPDAANCVLNGITNQLRANRRALEHYRSLVTEAEQLDLGDDIADRRRAKVRSLARTNLELIELAQRVGAGIPGINGCPTG